MDASLIIKDIQAKKFAPLYFLHGEETYYIDLITEAIQKHCLEEHERDFNQTILYGKDAELLALQSELKAYPMMAERRLVILKEAQDFKHLDALEAYSDAPSPTTISPFPGRTSGSCRKTPLTFTTRRTKPSAVWNSSGSRKPATCRW